MPATSPRLTVTLPPDVAAILRDTAAAAGVSQSSIVAEVLQSYLPILDRMLSTLRYLNEGKQADVEKWVSDFHNAQTVVEELVAHTEGQLDLLFPHPSSGAAEASAPAGPAEPDGEARAKRPPYSNRGVKPGNSPRKGGKVG